MSDEIVMTTPDATTMQVALGMTARAIFVREGRTIDGSHITEDEAQELERAGFVRYQQASQEAPAQPEPTAVSEQQPVPDAASPSMDTPPTVDPVAQTSAVLDDPAVVVAPDAPPTPTPAQS